MKPAASLVASLCLLTLAHQPSHADDRLKTGFFVDASLGASGIAFESIGLVESGDTSRGSTPAKISAGYWFSKYWGASINAVRLGRFEQRFDAGEFRARADSVGIALMGRLPIGRRWTLTGKLNLARTRMRDDGSHGDTSSFRQYFGRETGIVLPAVELGYQLTDRSMAFVEIDPRGRAAEKVGVGYVGLGLRWSW